MHMVAAGLAVKWPWLAMTGPILPSLHNWAWKTLDFYPVDVAVKVVSNGTYLCT